MPVTPGHAVIVAQETSASTAATATAGTSTDASTPTDAATTTTTGEVSELSAKLRESGRVTDVETERAALAAKLAPSSPAAIAATSEEQLPSTAGLVVPTPTTPTAGSESALAGPKLPRAAVADPCHMLPLASSYAAVLHREPEFTNFTEKFQGTLDYVFFTRDSLQPLRVLGLPDRALLTAQVALPNEVFPSDHLALCTEFTYRRAPDSSA